MCERGFHYVYVCLRVCLSACLCVCVCIHTCMSMHFPPIGTSSTPGSSIPRAATTQLEKAVKAVLLCVCVCVCECV
jgi:hypothetical protein